MSQDQRRSAPGSVDPSMAQRVEALVDEAVGQAAKGSYREAAARAEQALTIDPDHAAARELLDSYRRLAADDEERRRRRRSIAAAAAAIEEMIEDGRLEEATTGTEALNLQYGHEAPFAELQARIAEARAGDLDFAELDAAIAAIRKPDPTAARAAQPAARLDAMETLAAEIEDHLRSGRLEEASGRLEQLGQMPGSQLRHDKLRTRIEDARHVAEDHRREEEILIATAAIEERLRRGDIDGAAARLAALDTRFGADAPVAELRQQVQDARVHVAATAASSAAPNLREPAQRGTAEPFASDRTAELLGAEDDLAGAATGAVDDDERPAGNWMAIAAVVAVVTGGGWWLYQQQAANGGEAAAGAPAAIGAAAPSLPSASDAATSEIDETGGDRAVADPSLAVTQAPGTASTDPDGATTDGAAASVGADGPADRPAASPAPIESRAGESAAPDSAASTPAGPIDTDSTRVTDVATDDGRQLASPAVPSAPGTGGDAAAVPLESSRPPVAAPGDPAPSEGSTDVVVEALPVTEAPPPVEAAAAPVDPAPSDDDAAGAASSAGVEAASADASPSAPDAAPAAEPQPAAAEAAAPESAAPAPTQSEARLAGPAILGCGTPDVVCVKALQVPTPAYPAQARARRLSANVVVMALVDERGRVIESRIEDESFAFFNSAALDAVNRAVFQPASRAGVPGRSWVRLIFRFDPR